MGQIATSDRHINLYCIEQSIIAKQTLAYAQENGVSIMVIDLLKTRISGSQLIEIANRLNLKLSELINQESDAYSLKFDPQDLSSEDWVKMIQQNPEILRQPIAMRGDNTVFVQTPTDILGL